ARIRVAPRQALGLVEGARRPRSGSRSRAFRPDAQPPSAHRARARVARACRGAAPARTHRGLVKQVRVTLRGKKAHMALSGRMPLDLELWALKKKAGLFE